MCQLAIGDTITVRVVNAKQADTPTGSRVELSLDDDMPLHTGLFPPLVNDPLNFFDHDAWRRLVFWVTLTIGALIVWFVSSHL